MRTAFEENLDSFFYGDTCVSELQVVNRVDGKAYANVSKKSRIGFSTKTINGILSAVVLTLAVSTAGVSLPSIKRANLKAESSRSHKLDERTKADLVVEVAELRERLGLTQQQLADLLNVSLSTISKFERSEHEPDASNMAKYQKFVQMVNYLDYKVGGRKFALRSLFHVESQVFDDMNVIDFAKAVGGEGLNEVYSQFKRIYG